MTSKTLTSNLEALHTEILDHCRCQKESLRHQREAHLHADPPSVTELLTIEQYGSRRCYNLNDGMGAELAC